MLYYQMPFYFTLGALLYLFPNVGKWFLAGYLGMLLARRWRRQ